MMLARRLVHGWLLVIIMLASFSVPAETVFIIDQVEVGLHETASVDSPILQILPTGTKLEVLAREGTRVKVRTGENTVGWIDERYLMPDKPTRQLLNEAEIQVTQLKAENQQLREQLETHNGQAAPAELEKLRKSRARLQTELADAREQVARLRQDLDAIKQGDPRETRSSLTGRASQWLGPLLGNPVYLAGLVAALLLVGLLLGIWFMDYLHRRRHGGFRV